MGTSPKSNMNGEGKQAHRANKPRSPKTQKKPSSTSVMSKAASEATTSLTSSWWPLLMQTLAAIIYNMAPLGMGIAIGFMGMSLPQVREDSTMDVTQDDSSWIASVGAIGGIIGSLVGIVVEDRLGRKGTFLLGCIPAALGLLMAASASTTATFLILGFFLNGVGATLLSSSAQIYLPEICEAKLRGLFLAAGGLFFTFGNLAGYVLGAVFSWRTVLWASAAPFCMAACSVLLPESPSWLASKGRRKEAEEALLFFRSNQAEVKEELRGVGHAPAGKSSGGRWSLIFTRQSLHPLLIVWTLFFISTFSGSAAIMSYTKDIFVSSGSQLDEVTATLLTGALQVVLNIVGGFLVQTVGRRPLLVTSGLGMAASLVLFASKDLFPGMTWLPPAAVWLYLCFLVPGFMNIPWMLMGELFPLRTRGILSCLTGCFFSFLFFGATKTFPWMMEEFGSRNVFAAYAAISACGALFAAFCVPETKDKSLAEIEAFFSAKKTSAKKKKN